MERQKLAIRYDYLQNKIILISGGTGSFGKAFIKEILSQNPKQVRVYSRDELKQAQLKEELKDNRVEYFLGDIRDYDRLCTALEGVDLVVHAAALKRIEKGESDPQEFIKTNIQGTINVANACLKNNVKSAVLISTDKAVYPINLYGASKLCAEKVWNQSNTYRGTLHPTKFSVVRYGNVIGSRGSVTSIFDKQLKEGVVKVTDTRMTRFFISLQQAVDLVQFALEAAQGGEIYIPVLKAVSIYRLACLIAGTVPVEVTSQRGGEKLHESLVTKEESTRMASFENFSIINPELTTWPYYKSVSDYVNWVEDSSKAAQYTDEEIQELLGRNDLVRSV